MESSQSKITLQKARVSRAYLDQAKSFGIQQDIAFCPCLEASTIEAYNNQILNGYPTSTQMKHQNSNIDSESIFKILAAAANINNAQKDNNMTNPGSVTHANNTNGNNTNKNNGSNNNSHNNSMNNNHSFNFNMMSNANKLNGVKNMKNSGNMANGMHSKNRYYS